ncbi:hypothetical protein Ctha_0416 [Chloroherpeton thalassium ATCC 35110]|uniref:Uncharacterized protein n=1 Tax=Chloroherpeton thalassium (strain ATCC 35110 / GB-78) TaxID=517418 RepID=B3QUI1_CHLT3|nr:hypothetical protein [Chloroherpeton thalassium]ACF12887.1 hypothetical protein Ctha_0416 [Chloroherpeton thalassium ATCC 35110]
MAKANVILSRRGEESTMDASLIRKQVVQHDKGNVILNGESECHSEPARRRIHYGCFTSFSMTEKKLVIHRFTFFRQSETFNANMYQENSYETHCYIFGLAA